jgi:O-antigen/teichoic acid export membrane protein
VLSISDRHAGIYLATRVFAALCNMFALVLFTRLAVPAVFGDYLLGFACAFVAYGICVQWLLQAFFARQAHADAARTASAALVAAGVMVALAGAGLALASATGLLSAAGCAGLVIGLSAFFAMVEIARARLQAGAVGLAGVLRAVLILALGAPVLALTQSAAALLGAVAVAHVLAALPVVARLRATLWASGFARPRREDIAGLVRYGWPLILSLGAAALALNLDRLLIGHFHGPEPVAAYGATADFVKQSFVLVGEAVAAAYVSVAKAAHGRADMAGTRRALERALAMLSIACILGVVFFLVFGPALFRLLFAPGYQQAVGEILPILLAGTVCLVLRAYYFGQVIYFSRTAWADVASAGVMLAATGLAGWLLVPHWATVGAALAFALGQLAGLLVFVLADPGGRLMPRYPRRLFRVIRRQPAVPPR